MGILRRPRGRVLNLGRQTHLRGEGKPLPVPGEPIIEPLETFELAGCNLVGDPGAFKTVQAINLLEQAAKQNTKHNQPWVFVVIDPKGTSPAEVHRLAALAKKYGVPFRYVSVESENSHIFNPLENLLSSAGGVLDIFTEEVVRALEVGTGLGHAYFQLVARDGLKTIMPKITALNFENVQRHVKALGLRDVDGLISAASALGDIASLNASSLDEGYSAEQREHAVNFADMFEQGKGIVYVRLPRLKRSVGRAILSSVVNAAASVNSKRDPRTNIYLLVDEMHSIISGDGEYVSLIKSMGRDAKLFLWSCVQNTQQLVRIAGGNGALANELLTGPTLYFGSTDSGQTNHMFQHESELEIRESNEHGTSYRTEPILRSCDLEFITNENKGARYFYARVPKAKYMPTRTYLQLQFQQSHREYLKQHARGFFEAPGSLPGGVMNTPELVTIGASGVSKEEQEQAELAEKLRKIREQLNGAMS